MHADVFLRESAAIAAAVDRLQVEQLVTELAALRERGGRLYLIGLGGSAANCSHAAADLRTLCEIDAYALCDNIAEFSARANDAGWILSFDKMLSARRLKGEDALMVLSVGGGRPMVSAPITFALCYAKSCGAKIFGIVGPDGGSTAEMGDVVVCVPSFNDAHVTPHTEAFQAVIWHCLVSHPMLQRNATKW